MLTRILPVVLVACVIAACPFVNAQDNADQPFWPEFRGPKRDGISPEKGLLKKWPEGGPRLIWKYSDCGRGYSGVSLAEGKIFTAGDFDDEERLITLDLDGKLLWTAPNGKSWRGASPGSRTTPTYDDGILYHMGPHGRLAAFQAKDGKEIWAVDLKKRFDADFGVWALSENVIVEDDKVLCMPGGGKAIVVALDKKNGETVWTTTGLDEKAAYCSPVVVTQKGIKQLLTMTSRSVLSVDVASGKLLWRYPYRMRFSQHATTPVYHEGHVFVACGHSTGGTLLKINDSQDGVTKVWYRQEFDNCHGGLLLLGDRMYGCGCRLGGKGFYCVDYLTGKMIDTDDTVGKVGITYADGTIYAINHKGRMYLMEVTDDGMEVVSHFDLPGKRKVNIHLAHPVICGGRMYLRFENHLHVYDVRAK